MLKLIPFAIFDGCSSHPCVGYILQFCSVFIHYSIILSGSIICIPFWCDPDDWILSIKDKEPIWIKCMFTWFCYDLIRIGFLASGMEGIVTTPLNPSKQALYADYMYIHISLCACVFLFTRCASFPRIAFHLLICTPISQGSWSFKKHKCRISINMRAT